MVSGLETLRRVLRVATFAIVWAIPIVVYAEELVSTDNPMGDSEYIEAVDDRAVIADPLELLNRQIFGLNKLLDKVIFRPVDSVYRIIVPRFGREMVHNALSNILEPVNALNAFLQGNADDGVNACGRFMTNTIVGLAGLHDVAKEAGLERKSYGFGSTLRHYGVGAGPYIVLPILGPSSPREAIGMAADYVSNPFTYVFDSDTKTVLAVAMLLDTKDQYMDASKSIEEAALDEYATVRSLFAQQHQ